MTATMPERAVPFPDKDRKHLLLTLLKVMGGKKVVVEFAGSGDSGPIEGTELLDSNNEAISLEGAEFEWHTTSSVFNPDTNRWEKKLEVKPMPLSEILEQITYDSLEVSGHDWYNNEGGQGTLEIDLYTEPPEITLNVGINYMETTHHSYDFTEDGEDEEGEPTQYADLDAEDKARRELLQAIRKKIEEDNNAPTSS